MKLLTPGFCLDQTWPLQAIWGVNPEDGNSLLSHSSYYSVFETSNINLKKKNHPCSMPFAYGPVPEDVSWLLHGRLRETSGWRHLTDETDTNGQTIAICHLPVPGRACQSSRKLTSHHPQQPGCFPGLGNVHEALLMESWRFSCRRWSERSCKAGFISGSPLPGGGKDGSTTLLLSTCLQP